MFFLGKTGDAETDKQQYLASLEGSRRWFQFLGTEEQEIVKEVPLETLRKLDAMEDDNFGDNEERNNAIQDIVDVARSRARGQKRKAASGGGSSGASGAGSKNKRAGPKSQSKGRSIERPIKYPDKENGGSGGPSRAVVELSDADKAVLAGVIASNQTTLGLWAQTPEDAKRTTFRSLRVYAWYSELEADVQAVVRALPGGYRKYLDQKDRASRKWFIETLMAEFSAVKESAAEVRVEQEKIMESTRAASKGGNRKGLQRKSNSKGKTSK